MYKTLTVAVTLSLTAACALAEPGDVGNVHQQRRGRQGGDDFLAKGVFVADVNADALAGKA